MEARTTPVDACFLDLTEQQMHRFPVPCFNRMREVVMGSRWMLAIMGCFLIGCGTGETSEKPEIFGQFEKVGPIIRDTVIGLEWQVCPDHDISWDDARAWVDGLGESWRMPTIEELKRLWDSGISISSWGPFENSGNWVWSGELYDSSSAWVFAFSGGYEYWTTRSYSGDCRAFAVRPR
jgi:hypothetical protein